MTQVARSTLALVFCAAGCGSGGDSQPADRESTRATGVRIATQGPASGLRSWGAPSISGTARGYSATLRPTDSESGQPITVRLAGVGYPGTGSGGGARYVGPGVATPWTHIAHGQYVVSVGHRGKTLGLRVWSRGGRWRAKVDGRYVESRPRQVGSDYALHTVSLSFRGASGTRRHVVDFELSGGAWLAGISAGRDDELWLPPQPKGARVYWLGDSYFAGGGAHYPGFSDLVHTASARLGAGDVTVDALGGTGYLKDNTPAKFEDYLTRARKNLGPGKAQPDVIVVGGSINDVVESPIALGAAARRLYAYLARAVPKAKVVVVPFAPHFPVPANFATRNRAILSAAAASPNVAGGLDLPGRVARSASGTASRLQGRDGHPSQAGHDRYGRVIADFIRSL